MRDWALETGEKVKFPWGFGEFTISKKQSKRKVIDQQGNEHIGLPIDWKKTKEKGRYIYHFNFNTEGFRFKWKWFVNTGRFFLHKVWVFKPSRVSSRLIKHFLSKEGQQYKYHEWSSTYINK